MICGVCYGVLRGHQGSQWKGTYDLHFDHHRNRLELERSVSMSCCICRTILAELSQVEQKRVGKTTRVWNRVYSSLVRVFFGEWFRLGQRYYQIQNHFISAYLSEVYDGLYRLDFKARNSDNVGTFVLQKTGESFIGMFFESKPYRCTMLIFVIGYNEKVQLDTPFSHNTSSDEVLELAKDWIYRCRKEHTACPGEDSETPRWYPTRLIDLGEVWESNDEEGKYRTGDYKKPNEVRLIISREMKDMKDYYVTLSHCWGESQPLQLNKDNEEEFKNGIEVGPALPQTFLDAINFARRLGIVPRVRPDQEVDTDTIRPRVRYIWIDSLCIIQGDRDDWLRESTQMYEIYNYSYCNISATAATDSGKGLYHSREPQELWEDEINLNVEGIPAAPGETSRANIQRCAVVDLSFWRRSVDEAPVNVRGWVLQERLMAPRVLHFCENQVVWECRELDAAESARDGVPNLRLQGGSIVAGGSLKSLVPYQARQSLPETSPTTATDQSYSPADTYNRWKLVVEVYSKTKLTKSEDKLIALSGIAKMVSDQVHDEYQAGLWRHHMEHQLLWRVDPVFVKDNSEDGHFVYNSKRPQDKEGVLVYRAPTWSWAAIDAPHGITYGDITPTGKALMEVHSVKVATVTDDKFGLVEDGSLMVSGKLKKIQMNPISDNKKNRYRWNLENPESQYEHSNVFLDSQSTDTDILGPEGRLYCLLAFECKDQTLICLLLQLENSDSAVENYRRVGLTRIPIYESGRDELLELSGTETDVPHGNWDAKLSRHTICIV